MATKKNTCIVDIGAGYGVFCEELQKILPSTMTVVALEPSVALQQICSDKGVFTVRGFLEDCSRSDFPCRSIAAATSFELLEHLHDPGRFVSACHSLLDSGGLLILTTLSWDGFDLQVLQEQSKSIHPPHHINFFTVRSVCTLLQRHGFVVHSVTTPGKLDVDIAAKQIPDIKCGFARNLLTLSNEAVKAKFQEFLQDAKLSSHMMVVAQKR
jgi:SAM-dependent methyltransferase